MTARNRAVSQGSTPKMEKALDKAYQKEDHTDTQAADSQHADNGQTGLGRVEQDEELRDRLNDPVADEGKDLEDCSGNTASTGKRGKCRQERQIHRKTTFQKL